MKWLVLLLTLSLLPAGGAMAAANVEVSVHVNGEFNMPGDDAEILLHVTNSGPDAAADVVVTVPVPPGSQLIGVTAPAEWTCSLGGDAVTCLKPSLRVTPPADHDALTLTIRLSPTVSGGFFYSATAEAANSPRSTFDVQYFIYRVVAVTTTNDSGPGSLREAILAVNAAGIHTPWKISFDLPRYSVFEPVTPLPAITSCGYGLMEAPGIPLSDPAEGDRTYELSGARVKSGSGLEFTPSCTDGYRSVRVSGFAINGFPENGVLVHPDASGFTYRVQLSGVFVGTDMTGTIARPNGFRGVATTSATAQLQVASSIVSGNSRTGVWAWDSSYVEILSSKIGIGADGRAMGNRASGVFILRGQMRIMNTTVAHNAHWGVSAYPGATMDASGANSFYSNGVLGVDWGVDFQTLGETRTSPAAPVITSATYDPVANATIVRGTITIATPLPGDWNAFHVYSSGGSRSAHGFVEGERWEGSGNLYGRNTPGTYEWSVVISGRDLRGRILTAVTAVGWSGGFTHTSSEFSLPVAVN